GVFPARPDERRMACGKRARGALSVHPHFAELGVLLGLHEVVADLVDQLQIFLEDLPESLRDLLVDDEPIEDGVVPTRRDGVEIALEVLRVGREVAEIEIGDLRVLLLRHLEVVSREAMAEAATSGVDLNEERARLLASLQLDE